MPSKSKKQARFMRAVAHNSEFAKKAGVPQSVGREFVAADKRARMAGGGRVKNTLDAIRAAGARAGYNSNTREFRVTPKGVTRPRAEELAYYTDDAEDAISTARTMLRELAERGTGETVTPMRIEIGAPKPAPTVGGIEEFLRRLDAETYPNPLDPRTRVFKDNTGMVDASRYIGDKDYAYITDLRAIKPGGGNRVLRALKRLSDETGTPLTGVPSPIGDKGLDDDRLMDWYEHHGFEPEMNEIGMFTRQPVKKAGGGRAGAMRRLSGWLEDRKIAPGEHPFRYGTYSENTEPYLESIKGWDPIISAHDYDMMDRWADGRFTNVLDKEIAALTKRHGLPLDEVIKNAGENNISRAIGTTHKYPREWGQHSTLNPQSISFDEQEVEEFARTADNLGLDPLIMRIEPRKDVLVLPVPGSGQSEFVLPQGSILRTRDRLPSTYGAKGWRDAPLHEDGAEEVEYINYLIEALGQDRSRWAEGGSVGKSRYGQTGYESGVRKIDQGLADAPEDGGEALLARYLLRGAGRLWSTPDDENPGHIKPSGRGFVDTIVGLPAVLSPLTDYVASSLVPGKRRSLHVPVPKASERAAERSIETANRVDELAIAPHHALFDAVGDMGSQLPLPMGALRSGFRVAEEAAPAARGIIKALGAIPEYLTPTIEPRPGNYAQGITGGTALGAAADDEMSHLNPQQYLPVSGGPDAEEILGTFGKNDPWLRDEYAYLFGDDEMNSAMFGPLTTPQYADGGQAKPHNPANDYEPGLNRAANIRDGFPPRMSRAEREDLERRFGPLPPKVIPQQVVRKAGGGRIGDTASTVKAIKDALSALQSGDRTGAVRILRPHANSNGEIRRTVDMLRGPNSRSADSELRRSSKPNGPDYTPFLAGGGRVNAIREAFEAITRKLGPTSDAEMRMAPAAAVDPEAIRRAVSTLKGPTSDAEMRMSRGYRPTFDPRAALSPSAGGGQLATLTDRLALLEDAVRSMPAGQARDSIVDEYSGLRRQLSRQTGAR
jgi:hypothetical protein